jgi:hypothetical protein
MSKKIFKRTLIALGILSGVFVLAGSAQAKRAAPKKVEPVVHNDVKYTAPQLPVPEHDQVGGYVEAWSEKNGKKLWEVKVYKTKMEPPYLLVTNEAGQVFEVNIMSRQVRKRSDNQNNKSKTSILVK